MRKNKRILDETTTSRIYNVARNRLYYDDIERPKTGINSKVFLKSWKSHRKTQYKTVVK